MGVTASVIRKSREHSRRSFSYARNICARKKKKNECMFLGMGSVDFVGVRWGNERDLAKFVFKAKIKKAIELVTYNKLARFQRNLSR
jgi:hypothetical protein